MFYVSEYDDSSGMGNITLSEPYAGELDSSQETVDAPPDLDIVPLGYPLEGEVKEGASEEDLPVLVQESQEPFINNGGREKKT